MKDTLQGTQIFKHVIKKISSHSLLNCPAVVTGKQCPRSSVNLPGGKKCFFSVCVLKRIISKFGLRCSYASSRTGKRSGVVTFLDAGKSKMNGWSKCSCCCGNSNVG